MVELYGKCHKNNEKKVQSVFVDMIGMKEKLYSPENIVAVNFVCAIGAMVGDSDGLFHPEGNISNAEICVILANLFSVAPEKTTEEKLFKGHWAEPYITWIEDKLSQREYSLWFNKETINSPVSCQQVRDLFHCFFDPLIEPNSIKNETELAKTGDATRVYVATALYQYCLSFLNQLENYDVKELLQFWKASFISPYQLLFHISGTGMIRVPKLKNTSDKKAFYKLTLLKDTEPQKAPEIYQKLNAIDCLEDKCYEIFPIYIGKAYHYTTLEALYQMLTQSKETSALGNGNIGIKMFLGNAEYLNDPKEGQYFGERDETVDSGDKKGHVLYPKNTYVLSLTADKDERLPLWVQYGGNGTGCRIEFEIGYEDDFHNVLYIGSDVKGGPNAESVIQELKDNVEGQKELVIRQYIENVIERIKYYIKSSYYEHEKEIRHFSNSLPQLASVFPSPRSGEAVPRLYCELDRALKVKSIMLGPKCPNPNHVALFLYRCGVPEVQTSSIEWE